MEAESIVLLSVVSSPRVGTTASWQARKKRTHARKKVEDLADADYPAGAVPKALVCDVNAHPAQLVETIAPLVRALPPGAPVVLTLKFGGKGHEAACEARKLTHAAEVLADLGDVAPFAADFRLEWLVSNTKRERTLIAFRA